MNQEIFEALYQLYLDELRAKIEYDKEFFIDVRYDNGSQYYILLSSLYTEGGDEIWTDYDQPREFKNPCISANSWTLIKSDDNDNQLGTYNVEAAAIIKNAIQNF